MYTYIYNYLKLVLHTFFFSLQMTLNLTYVLRDLLQTRTKKYMVLHGSINILHSVRNGHSF